MKTEAINGNQPSAASPSRRQIASKRQLSRSSESDESGTSPSRKASLRRYSKVAGASISTKLQAEEKGVQLVMEATGTTLRQAEAALNKNSGDTVKV